MPPDIQELHDQLEAAERDAEALVAGLSEDQGTSRPGRVGALFIASLEPPPKGWSKLPAPKKIRPRPAPPLAESFADFKTSLADVRDFLRAHHDLDLAGVPFPNPFLPGVRFSLATGLHVILAHIRRHLWQGWRVRGAIKPPPPW